MEILNIIFGLIGVVGVASAVFTAIFRSKNKTISNDLIHTMKLQEQHIVNESVSKRLENLEIWKSDISVNLAEIKKDIHFIAESIKTKSL